MSNQNQNESFDSITKICPPLKKAKLSKSKKIFSSKDIVKIGDITPRNNLQSGNNIQSTKLLSFPSIKWFKMSCRLDSFLTVMYHIYFKETGKRIFEIGHENCKDALDALRDCIFGIDASISVDQINLHRNQYAAFRAKKFKEKINASWSLTQLFQSTFEDHPYFCTKAETVLDCDVCSKKESRILKIGPIIVIPPEIVKSNKGKASDALYSVLTDYMVQCSNCDSWMVVKKNISNMPKYLVFVFDYLENKKVLDEMIKDVQFTVDPFFNYLNNLYFLKGIIYFPPGHYNCHVHGLKQNTLISEKFEDTWFFHDGMKNNGEIISDDYKQQMDLQENRPYILLYSLI